MSSAKKSSRSSKISNKKKHSLLSTTKKRGELIWLYQMEEFNQNVSKTLKKSSNQNKESLNLIIRLSQKLGFIVQNAPYKNCTPSSKMFLQYNGPKKTGGR